MILAREIGDRQEEANSSWNLGLVYGKENDLPRAIAAMQVLVDFEREISHLDGDKHAAEVNALRAKLAGEQPGQGNRGD